MITSERGRLSIQSMEDSHMHTHFRKSIIQLFHEKRKQSVTRDAFCKVVFISHITTKFLCMKMVGTPFYRPYFVKMAQMVDG